MNQEMDQLSGESHQVTLMSGLKEAKVSQMAVSSSLPKQIVPDQDMQPPCSSRLVPEQDTPLARYQRRQQDPGNLSPRGMPAPPAIEFLLGWLLEHPVYSTGIQEFPLPGS